MFDIFTGYIVLALVCFVVGTALVAILSHKHEDADSTYYDNTIKH